MASVPPWPSPRAASHESTLDITIERLRRSSVCAVIFGLVVSLRRTHPNPTIVRRRDDSAHGLTRPPRTPSWSDRRCCRPGSFSVLQKEQRYGSSWPANTQE